MDVFTYRWLKFIFTGHSGLWVILRYNRCRSGGMMMQNNWDDYFYSVYIEVFSWEFIECLTLWISVVIMNCYCIVSQECHLKQPSRCVPWCLVACLKDFLNWKYALLMEVSTCNCSLLLTSLNRLIPLRSSKSQIPVEASHGCQVFICEVVRVSELLGNP